MAIRKPLLVLAVLLIAVLACGGGTPQSVSTPTEILAVEAPTGVSVIINASEGGELTLPDNTVLRIPPGSLPKDVQISVRKLLAKDTPSTQQGLASVGSAYDINLGTDRLEKPATLEIPFDPTLLPDGVESRQVFLSYYDENKNEWVYSGGKVDTSRNVVVLQITHASWWMPTTWNWGAWIAILNKILRVSIVDWIEAVQLLTDDCPQTGEHVRVNSNQARNIVQGCVERDNAERPELRVINPKSFFFEVKPISGGNGYPAPTLLSPGEDLTFEASTSDPSPLIVEAQMTQKSGWYLVVHMVITMLPGANQFGIQGRHVACITERLADVSYFASAVESLLVDHNGAAAAESVSQFMLDSDAVRRFITAADDCDFGPAPTWSVEGVRQIGGAVSTIMSATDYIANYFAGNTSAQISFIWTTSSPPQPIATVKDGGKVYLDTVLILDVAQEDLGCFGVDKISYSPTQNHFLVLLQCFEGDNEAFLFRADGSNKTRITGKWDYINYSNAAWSWDGKYIAYERINSCCVSPQDIPVSAPPKGLVRYDVETGTKTLLVKDVFLFPMEWSPNGRWIAFIFTGSATPSENAALYLVEADSASLWELDKPVATSDCSSLRWDWEEPVFSLRLYCMKSDGTRGQSYIINAAPGTPPSDKAVQVAQVTGPADTKRYRVVGVASNDVLNVRSGPGTQNTLVGTIPPDGTDIQITGEGVQKGTAYWVPVQYKDIVGWVNSSYLAEQSSSVAAPPTPLDTIGPEAIWKSADFTKFQDCRFQSAVPLIDCVVSAMQASGASPQAMEFAKMLQGEGFMEAFSEFGLVDVASVVYPSRANNNFQYVLVNGTPPIVRVEEVWNIDIRQDSNYPVLARKFPNLLLWASENNLDSVEQIPQGGQRFTFKYPLLNGCHACELGGYAFIAFDFDGLGNLLEVTLLRLSE